MGRITLITLTKLSNDEDLPKERIYLNRDYILHFCDDESGRGTAITMLGTNQRVFVVEQKDEIAHMLSRVIG